jgi:hypothetical protein
MIKYQDEIALGTLLLSITIAKINAAKMIAKMQASNIVEMPSQGEKHETEKKDEVM